MAELSADSRSLREKIYQGGLVRRGPDDASVALVEHTWALVEAVLGFGCAGTRSQVSPRDWAGDR